jgi:hypothetical protein
MQRYNPGVCFRHSPHLCVCSRACLQVELADKAELLVWKVSSLLLFVLSRLCCGLCEDSRLFFFASPARTKVTLQGPVRTPHPSEGESSSA